MKAELHDLDAAETAASKSWSLLIYSFHDVTEGRSTVPGMKDVLY
jgi:hypothetical protein